MHITLHPRPYWSLAGWGLALLATRVCPPDRAHSLAPALRTHGVGARRAADGPSRERGRLGCPQGTCCWAQVCPTAHPMAWLAGTTGATAAWCGTRVHCTTAMRLKSSRASPACPAAAMRSRPRWTRSSTLAKGPTQTVPSRRGWRSCWSGGCLCASATWALASGATFLTIFREPQALLQATFWSPRPWRSPRGLGAVPWPSSHAPSHPELSPISSITEGRGAEGQRGKDAPGTYPSVEQRWCQESEIETERHRGGGPRCSHRGSQILAAVVPGQQLGSVPREDCLGVVARPSSARSCLQQ